MNLSEVFSYFTQGIDLAMRASLSELEKTVVHYAPRHEKKGRLFRKYSQDHNSRYTELLFLIQEGLDTLKYTSQSHCSHLAPALGEKLGQPCSRRHSNLVLHSIMPELPSSCYDQDKQRFGTRA